jgi:hypothetical protein
MSHRRPAQGVGLLLASAVTQSTLVLASVSVAYLLGGGGVALALPGRERVELLLTAATILMAVAALAALKPEPVDGWIMTAAAAGPPRAPGPRPRAGRKAPGLASARGSAVLGGEEPVRPGRRARRGDLRKCARAQGSLG